MSSDRDIGYKATLPFREITQTKQNPFSVAVYKQTEKLKHLLEGHPNYIFKKKKSEAAITNFAELKVEKMRDKRRKTD